MITVTFISADGESREVQAVDGRSLLDVAQAAGQPLEGTCEGQMACSTCHVIIDKDWLRVSFSSLIISDQVCHGLIFPSLIISESRFLSD